MGKRGPAPTSLSELLFWEQRWYWTFRSLRGAMPSAEIALGRRRYRELLKDELEELRGTPSPFPRQSRRQVRRGVPLRLSDTPSDQEIFREMRKSEIEAELEEQPAEPKVWKALVGAQSDEEVFAACQNSKRWLNPSWRGRAFVRQLWDNVGRFFYAREYAYYPRLESGDKKRVAFFARAMAGIACGISPITAIDRLRKLPHGQNCRCVNCDVKRSELAESRFYKPLTQITRKEWRKK